MCVIKSIDGTTISAFRVHECEGSSRMGSRPRRFLFTGHTNGGIQVGWRYLFLYISLQIDFQYKAQLVRIYSQLNKFTHLHQ